jgi:hypothetical protein
VTSYVIYAISVLIVMGIIGGLDDGKTPAGFAFWCALFWPAVLVIGLGWWLGCKLKELTED